MCKFVNLLGHHELLVLEDVIKNEFHVIIAYDCDESEKEWFYTRVVDERFHIAHELEWTYKPTVEESIDRMVVTVSNEHIADHTGGDY